MGNKNKPLAWIGSSHKDLCALPKSVVKGFGGAGVLEVVENDVGGTYRAVYTVKFAEAVFVLHCFQKKSKAGIAIPKADMDIIHTRLKQAEEIAKVIRYEQTGKTLH
jgi:phage-related protein